VWARSQFPRKKVNAKAVPHDKLPTGIKAQRSLDQLLALPQANQNLFVFLIVL
jgi:hypothetical protein